eukprot:4594946-Amphidinium_carterae.1
MPKRPATPEQQELTKRLRRIDKAVAEQSGLTPSVTAMLRAMAPFALADPKAQRHQFQHEAVCWIADALQCVEKQLDSQVEAAATHVDEALDALAAARRRQLLTARAVYEDTEEDDEDEEVKAERQEAERDLRAKQAASRGAGSQLLK